MADEFIPVESSVEDNFTPVEDNFVPVEEQSTPDQQTNKNVWMRMGTEQLGMPAPSDMELKGTVADVPKYVEQGASLLFSPFNYLVKQYARVTGKVEEMFGSGTYAGNTAQNERNIGNILNSIGWVSSVAVDYAGDKLGVDKGQAKLDLMDRIVQNWKSGKTLGQSYQEVATAAGLNKGEWSSMLNQLTAQGIDLTTTLGTVKALARGVPTNEVAKVKGEVAGAKTQMIADDIKLAQEKEMVSKVTSQLAAEKNIQNITEIQKLAKEADIQDAIQAGIKERTVEVQKATGDFTTIDEAFSDLKPVGETPMEKWTREGKPQAAPTDMTSLGRIGEGDNLLGVSNAIELATKDVYTGDSALGITPEMRQNFAKNANNLFKVAPNETDWGIIGRTVQGAKDLINKAKYWVNSPQYQPFTGMVKRLGKLKEGTQFSKEVAQFSDLADRHSGEFIGELSNFKKWLPFNKKNLEHLQKVVQGVEKARDVYTENLAKKIRTVYDKVFDTAANKYNFQVELADGSTVSLKSRFRENYDYRMMDLSMSKEGGEFRDINIGKIKDKLKITDQKAAEMLDAMINNNEAPHGSAARNGSLHFARDYELEGYDTDPIRSLVKYVKRTSEEMASIDLWGDGQKGAFDQMNKMADANQISKDNVYKLFHRAIGQYSTDEVKLMSTLKPIQSYEAIKNLQFSGIGNIQQLAQSARYDIVRGAWDAIKHFKESKEFANECGALAQTTLNRLTNMNGIMGQYFKYNLFTTTQAATEILGSASARRTALRMFDQYKNNQVTLDEMKLYSQHVMQNKRIFNETPANAWKLAKIWDKQSKAIHAQRQLQEFGIDAHGALKSGKLSYDDILNAGEKGAKFASDKPVQGLMPMWTESPQGKLAFLYKGWAMAHVKNMLKLYGDCGKEFAITKDPRAFTPIIKLAIANGVGTEVTDIMRKLLTGKPITGEENGKMKWWIEYAGNMTLGGLFTTYMSAASLGERAIVGAATGPVGSDVIKGVSAVGSAVLKGKPKPLAREAIRDLPLPSSITKPIQNAVVPPENK
jgi:hypothetical protein